MARASFVRSLRFNGGERGLALVQADLYEDDNRVYAFLTFENRGSNPYNVCVVRITPFDDQKLPLPAFGIKIEDLLVKVGNKVTYEIPMLLPKGTYAFNYAFVSAGYNDKRKGYIPTDFEEEPKEESKDLVLGTAPEAKAIQEAQPVGPIVTPYQVVKAKPHHASNALFWIVFVAAMLLGAYFCFYSLFDPYMFMM